MIEHVVSRLSACIEDTAFIFITETEFESFDAVCATISYETAVKGSFSLCCSKQLGIILAANLLGIEEQSNEAEANYQFAVAEILNIVGGMLVPDIWGETISYSLGVPVLTEQNSAQLLEIVKNSDEYVCFDADGEPILFIIHEDKHD